MDFFLKKCRLCKFYLILYFSDEYCLRFYLHGRSVNLYAPTSNEDYQLGKQIPPPTQRLKLEWVYPCVLLRISLHERVCVQCV